MYVGAYGTAGGGVNSLPQKGQKRSTSTRGLPQPGQYLSGDGDDEASPGSVMARPIPSMIYLPFDRPQCWSYSLLAIMIFVASSVLSQGLVRLRLMETFNIEPTSSDVLA